jgi:hypothetical protein
VLFKPASRQSPHQETVIGEDRYPGQVTFADKAVTLSKHKHKQ